MSDKVLKREDYPGLSDTQFIELQEELGPTTDKKEHRHFIENIIAQDLLSNKHNGKVITRFPPEPNGYLHLGHAKSICLNFGLARDNLNTRCHLRFDDTNPLKESDEYVQSIKEDVHWLGFDWKNDLFFSSDYFDKLYEIAVELIKKGLAYVDHQSGEEISANRGSFEKAGTNSPFRDRSVEENLDLFQQMKDGKIDEGACVLRAKIDMAHPNMVMRDPILYRIRKVHHHRTGDKWCIYPMYDFTHGLSDAIEGITHSLCTLEFQDNRPLYDWFVEKAFDEPRPRQIEFARLNLDYTVMSKRKLLELVEKKIVMGWDDPRMPTISGVRRRGYPPRAIRRFMDMIGVGKQETTIELSMLEECVRKELNASTKRFMGVIDPIEVEITNIDEATEILALYHPQHEEMGERTLLFEKFLYIDQSDFMKDPPSPKKWFRLGPDRSVRLRWGPVITCDEYIEDEHGKVIKLKCRMVPGSFNGQLPEDHKKVKGIIHWVSKTQAKSLKVRLFDRLFQSPSPGKDHDWLKDINPDSLIEVDALVEESLLTQAAPDESFQLERVGYFCFDSKESTADAPILNRTVSLKDNWSKKKD